MFFRGAFCASCVFALAVAVINMPVQDEVLSRSINFFSDVGFASLIYFIVWSFLGARE